eukprot:UN18485
MRITYYRTYTTCIIGSYKLWFNRPFVTVK